MLIPSWMTRRGFSLHWREELQMEIARGLQLEVEPEDVAELLQSHDKT